MKSTDRLHLRYPLARRAVILQTFWWILASLIAFVITASVHLGLLTSRDNFGTEATTDLVSISLCAAVLAITAAKVVYWEMYRRRTRFSIRGTVLEVTRGIILRNVETFNLSKIVDLCIHVSPAEYMLGVCRVKIQMSGSEVELGGFSSRSARSLITYLRSIIVERAHRQIFDRDQIEAAVL